MSSYDVYIYDAFCNPLEKEGIGIELYNSSNNRLLCKKATARLSPGEWGVRLEWSSANDPIEMLFNDPQRVHSGAAVLELNGRCSGRIDKVLLALPDGPGHPPGGLKNPSSGELNRWVFRNNEWIPTEMLAVWRLIGNFSGTILSRFPNVRTESLHSFARSLQVRNDPDRGGTLELVAVNWAHCLKRVGVDLRWIHCKPLDSGSSPLQAAMSG